MDRSASVFRRGTISGALVVLSLAAGAHGDETDPGEHVFTDGLSGRTIYERVADNRFASFAQKSLLVSADRAGHFQESRFQMEWKSFRDENGDATKGVLSKTLVKYTHPFDLRHSGYLIQANDGRPSDQFVYYPSRRRVVRVNLRNEVVYGTDFSLEDVVPREPQDFDYRRLPDERYGEVPVHVVELFPREFVDTEYSRIQVYVERERPVVLRARYWDAAGVEVKELEASPEAVEKHEGVWVVTRSTMRNLLLESWTRLEVDELEPNPDFDRHTFEVRRLESH